MTRESRSERTASQELDVLDIELDRQRERFGRKESTKNTRALLLVGASTVVAGAGGAPSTLIDFAIGGLVLIAAALGILAIRPSKGGEVDLVKLEEAIRGSSRYRAELTLYRNKLKVHRADIEYLTRRSTLVTGGFWILLLGIAVKASDLMRQSLEQFGVWP